MFKVDPILTKETTLSCLKEEHKQELLATFKVMSKEEKAAILTEMTGVEVEDSKKTEKEGKAEEEEGEETMIKNYNDYWGHNIMCYTLVTTHCWCGNINTSPLKHPPLF